MNFIIWAPDYRHTSGGIMTLHKLCHLLNTNGYQAAMNCGCTNPEWNTPISGNVTSDTIVIYPEVVSGNPLGSSKVVRWVLNNPGHIGGERRYDDSELVFYWPLYRKGAQSATSQILTEDHELSISFFDPNIFYKNDTPRTKTCYFPDGPTQFIPPDSIRINNLSLESLGQLLRESKTFYTFREDTGLITEALMCGTPVVHVTTEGQHNLWDKNIAKHLDYIDYDKWIPEFWIPKWNNMDDVHKLVRMCKQRWNL